MIVYGDPQYQEGLPNLVEQLRQRIEIYLDASLNKDAGERLQQLRSALILAGQLEQAAYDASDQPGAQGYNSSLHDATTHIGAAFYAAWAEQNGAQPTGGLDREASLAGALAHLAGAVELPEAPVAVKMPEGFAFYTLYPEQYCAAALRWLDAHQAVEGKRAVVVGIRSIGTTLAAVVAATLTAHGRHATSLTLRPTGHPFRREAHISPEQVEGAEWGLVVDEGPGLSGSSMSAVGQALVRAGLSRHNVSFFSSHANGPGSATSDEVRAWWSGTPTYVVPLGEMRFGGLSLPESLAAWLTARDDSDPVTQIEDASGGRWREWLYEDGDKWPPACAPFERTKYLCTTRSGRRVLFKFEGLCGAPGTAATTAELVQGQLADRATSGWTAAPVGVVNGFVAGEWVEGKPLGQGDCDPAVLRHVGRYVAAVSGPALTVEQHETGSKRLAEMLYWNAWEALGEAMAERTRPWAERLQAVGHGSRSYGDGRMAPHEWIRTNEGQLVKADSAGHAWDHTCIGPQPVAWDLAGAIVEWGLNDEAAGVLSQAFYAAVGERITEDALTAYRLAYAAFRAGQCHLCANMSAHDPTEQARLGAAYTRYKDMLAALL
ncbi:MAG TPA: hypothetical protein VFH60_10910 [Chloroflexia bacterium]|nr:hypothetical protein [Chloroflexia bacterium]